MSLPDEFIRMARALAFYRKFKHRRARRRGRFFTDGDGLKGWEAIGSGFYGEAWSHKDYPGLVVKISGRAGFGVPDAVPSREPSLDGWPVFAEHCLANPHQNLPKIMYFERLSLGISFGIMPYYVPIETHVDEDAAEILDRWRDYLEGDCGAPKWLWPMIGMRAALGMRVDLHSGNVMKDPNTGAYIMTDPFSAEGTYPGTYTDGYCTDL